MLKYFREDVLFIHNPKTGGSSIDLALYGRKWVTGHGPCQLYINENENKFNNAFKFMFVRNPYDRLVSTYFYLISDKCSHYDENIHNRLINETTNFNSYINYLCSINDYSNLNIHHNFQYIYAYDDNLTERVDYIGKFENLQNDFENICEIIQFPKTKLEIINSSVHPYYKELYTDEIAEKVYTLYKKDFDLFDYDKHSYK